jgi:hypothetical protein
MKKLILIFVLVFLAIGVSAQLDPPGDFLDKINILDNIRDFFKNVIAGNAQTDDVLFISFFLYFIVFLAIFIEGVRFLPIFGERGSTNSPGKWFAFSAAALSTVALFVLDIGGVSQPDRVASLVAPFGIWGGLAIAALIAYITFRLIRDFETFRDQTALAMAIAGAVGVTFAGFLLNLNTLLGYSFMILILVFIGGGIRAFSLRTHTPTAEHPDTPAGRRAAAQHQAEQRQGRRDREDREDRIREPLARMTEAMNNARDLRLDLSRVRQARRQQARDEAEGHLTNMRDNLSRAVRSLRGMVRRRRMDQETHNFLGDVLTQIAAQLQAAEEINLPDADAQNWGEVTNTVREAARIIYAATDAIRGRLQNFVDTNAREIAEAQVNEQRGEHHAARRRRDRNQPEQQQEEQ